MPRAALILAVAAGLVALGSGAGAQLQARLSPHLDPGLMPGGCAACHRGHGSPGSPMLPEAQVPLCLGCHGSRGDLDRRVARGEVSGSSRPPLLSSVLAQPFVHPMDVQAHSRLERGVVVCTSCHSPHRGSREFGERGPAGRPRVSPRDPGRLEYHLCEECHGSEGPTTQSLADLSRLFYPGNRSYHPVHAPARETSPSVRPSLAGREINCTDCHGSSDPRGPAGPHGSSEPFLLRARYATSDGSPEGPATYALCYGCHRRSRVLRSPSFPGHERHVVEIGASCATCHSAHGSVRNRALIRFGEETVVSGVSPSATTGRLGFVSSGPGSGSCFLTCHGRDHAGESYGLGLGGSGLPRR